MVSQQPLQLMRRPPHPARQVCQQNIIKTGQAQTFHRRRNGPATGFRTNEQFTFCTNELRDKGFIGLRIHHETLYMQSRLTGEQFFTYNGSG